MYHIASCALVIDSSIHIWDVRRPYIPYASFNDHKDITTGIAWRGNPDVLLSTSKVTPAYPQPLSFFILDFCLGLLFDTTCYVRS